MEYGIYSQDPFFEVIIEKFMQINNNPELFGPLLPFFGPKIVLSQERTVLFRVRFGYAPRISKNTRLEESFFLGENRFFVGDVAIALGSRA